jgi:hypothetical protein
MIMSRVMIFLPAIPVLCFLFDSVDVRQVLPGHVL